VDVAAPTLEEPEAAVEVEVADVAASAPEEPEAAEEDVLDIAALAPDEPEAAEEDVLDIAALAREEPEAAEEDVLDIAALAPDEPEAAEEDVLDIAALAPDEPEAAEEDAPDVAALAPDEPEEPEEPETADTRPIVTRTMADLYVRQGFGDRALEVYRQLLEIRPDDAELRARIASLEVSLSRETETTGQAAETEEPLEGPLEAATDGDAVEDAFSEHVWRTERHAEDHEVETPFAWTAEEPEEEGPSRPPISEYFRRLLSWEAESDAETGEASEDGSPDGGDGEGGDVTSRMHPA